MINLWPVEEGSVTVNVALDVSLESIYPLTRQFVTYATFADMLRDVSNELSCLNLRHVPADNNYSSGIYIVKGERCFRHRLF